MYCPDPWRLNITAPYYWDVVFRECRHMRLFFRRTLNHYPIARRQSCYKVSHEILPQKCNFAYVDIRAVLSYAIDIGGRIN